MVLTDRMIRDTEASGEIVVDPFEDGQIQPASCDLRVGPAGISTKSSGKIDVDSRGFFELYPGDPGILLTRELLKFDLRHTSPLPCSFNRLFACRGEGF